MPLLRSGSSYSERLIITEALQHLTDGLNRELTAPICAVTYGSEVSHAVVEYAQQRNAKSIVLGVRRASLMSSHVPAHIAYRIITDAPCPVLTMAFPRQRPAVEVGSLSVQASAELPSASFVPRANVAG